MIRAMLRKLCEKSLQYEIQTRGLTPQHCTRTVLLSVDWRDNSLWQRSCLLLHSSTHCITKGPVSEACGHSKQHRALGGNCNFCLLVQTLVCQLLFHFSSSSTGIRSVTKKVCWLSELKTILWRGDFNRLKTRNEIMLGDAF